MSSISSSGEHILNHNGVSSPTDRSDSSKGTVSEEDERGSSTDKQAEAGTSKHQQPDTAPEVESEEQNHPKDEAGEINGHLNSAYKNLLDLAVHAISNGSQEDVETFPATHIGASLWTSAEKDALFSTLGTKGPNDVTALSRSIATKSEPEVRMYLLQLKAQASNDGPYWSRDNAFRIEEIPAAYEIGADCETALDDAAQVLNQYCFQQEVDLEKQRFGDFWLIDEGTAAEIEEHQCELSHQNELTIQDTGETEDGTDDSNDLDLKTGSNRKAESVVNPTNTSNLSGLGLHTLPVDLFIPQNFLQLSRSIFMNSAADKEWNWAMIKHRVDVSPTPALFRSALDDLHNLAVDVTRQLVNTSQFQAMTRLRAKDDSNPAAVVHEDDVRAAADILGLPDREQYWSSVARRCGVEVYSESNRFQRQPSFKTGYKLTYDEVEAELGFSRGREALKPTSDSDEEASETTNSRHGPDEDGSRADSGGQENLTDIDPSSGRTSSYHDSRRNTQGERKRKRSSIASDEVEEDDHLGSFDKAASRAEEKRLWNY